MCRSAWRTLTTQCKKLQVLTLRILQLPTRLTKRASGFNAAAMIIRDLATRDIITNKLREAFSPESLEVQDESHLHEGHAGHRPGGETHFRVYIVSEAFKGKSRVERHRMINAALSAELAGSVHALAIHAKASGEG